MAVPSRHSDPLNIAPTLRTFFVTSSITEKRNLLQSDRSATLFIDVLYSYRAAKRYFLHSFVVMPNHFYVLITIDSVITIERAVQFIKGGFAFRTGKKLGVTSPVWQRGFSEIRIYDSAACARILNYIAQNPVKWRLADRPEAFPYCSAHPSFELDELPRALKRVSMPVA
jgi:putative transposase